MWWKNTKVLGMAAFCLLVSEKAVVLKGNGVDGICSFQGHDLYRCRSVQLVIDIQHPTPITKIYPCFNSSLSHFYITPLTKHNRLEWHQGSQQRMKESLYLQCSLTFAPFDKILRSACHRTAFASTLASTSAPAFVSSKGV